MNIQLTHNQRMAIASQLARDEQNRKLKRAAAHKDILNKDAAKHVIEEIMSALKMYQFSVFQYEAACRHGLREAFCLDGHSWQRADREAERLVSRALMRLGAKRPSKIEAQAQYVISRENCQNCGVLLQKDKGADQSRFCSDECKTFLANHNSIHFNQVQALTRHMMYYKVRKQERPEKQCENCGKLFKAAHDNARACSPACAGKVRVDAIPRRACAVCKKNFKPKRADIRCCSNECSTAFQIANLPKRDCALCGTEFKPRSRGAKYCGSDCHTEARRINQQQRRKLERASRPLLTCEICSTEFEKQSNRQRYCCKECTAIAQRIGQQRRSQIHKCEAS